MTKITNAARAKCKALGRAGDPVGYGYYVAITLKARGKQVETLLAAYGEGVEEKLAERRGALNMGEAK